MKFSLEIPVLMVFYFGSFTIAYIYPEKGFAKCFLYIDTEFK